MSSKLNGPRKGRDITRKPVAGRAPAPAPQPRHQPPRQAVGNPKGDHASPLAVSRTAIQPATTVPGPQFTTAPDAIPATTATMAGRGDGL